MTNKEQTENIKLYVWEGEGVLTDYTDGMICVLAHNKGGGESER